MILKYNKANIFEAGQGVKLIPGVNTHIEKAAWDLCKNHPIVKIFLDDDIIEILDDSEKDGAKVISVVLKDLSQPKAIELVKQTVIEETLELMAKSEKRKPVLKAINEQLDALRNVEFRTQEQE